jgi:hypothetical protein
MKKFSKFQQQVIKRYYDNREQIDDQRLSELVTNLYLATPKKAEKMWQTAQDLMERLKIPKSRIDHVIEKRDVAILAAVVQDLQSGVIKRT